MYKTFINKDEKHNFTASDELKGYTRERLNDYLACYKTLEKRWDFGDNDVPMKLSRRELQQRKNLYTEVPSEKVLHLQNTDSNKDFFCTGYLNYLMECWNNDFGIEIAPCYVWNVILWRICQLVNQDSDTYRDLFTTSTEKQTIKLPIDEFDPKLFFNAIKDKIPTDTTHWFPGFAHQPPLYEESMKGLFAEMVEKFYGCFIYGCGIPAVRLYGDKQEWTKIIDALDNLPVKNLYISRARGIVNEMIDNLDNSLYWSTRFFTGTHCGSGSQVEYHGSIMKLAGKDSSIDLVPDMLSKFPFESDTSGNCYYHSGIMSAKIDNDGIAVPHYGQAVTTQDENAGKMSEETFRKTVLNYRFNKAVNAINQRNRKVMKRYYKSSNVWSAIYKSSSKKTVEERKAFEKEVWMTLTKHRSAKSRKAEKFIVDNIDDIVRQLGLKGLMRIKDLYSFSIHRFMKEFMEMRGDKINNDIGEVKHYNVPKFDTPLTYEEYMEADQRFIRSKL